MVKKRAEPSCFALFPQKLSISLTFMVEFVQNRVLFLSLKEGWAI